MADTNNIIPNGLRADVMRNKMENKDALKEDGYIYIGTGNKIKIEADENTYEIPETKGEDLMTAINRQTNGVQKIQAKNESDEFVNYTFRVTNSLTPPVDGNTITFVIES